MIRVKIANHVFGLENKYDFVRFMCRDYLCDDEPEVVFESEVPDVDPRRNKDILFREYYDFHRYICPVLLRHGVLLFHGSCLKIDGKAYLFTAPAHTGKSTHTRLWRERFGSRVTMINDDKPLLHFSDGGAVTAYGSPWNGHHYLDTNTSAPLAGIAVLKQAPENKMRRLSQQEAFKEFCSQAFIPGDFALRMKAIGLVGRLTQLPVFELACTPTQEAVELSEQIIANR